MSIFRMFSLQAVSGPGKGFFVQRRLSPTPLLNMFDGGFDGF
jgi:hypothetical protein